MYFIGFNGPPGCGKDTAAHIVCSLAGKGIITQPDGEQFTNILNKKFAEPLKNSVHALLGLSGRSHDAFEHVKDTRQELFMGKSPRAWYIAMSEAFAKVFESDIFFGKVLRNDLTSESVFGDPYSMVAISDCGFGPELKPIVHAMSPSDRMLIVRLHREGCNFNNDSRSYINKEDYCTNATREHITELDLNNNFDIETFTTDLQDAITSWIKSTV